MPGESKNSTDLQHSARLIITSCAATSSAAAGAWSSITIFGPVGIMIGGDTPILAAMASGMVVSLGKLFGKQYSVTRLIPLMLRLTRALLGETLTRGAMSFVPAVGTAVNVRDIYRLQVKTGWLFYVVLKQGRDPVEEEMSIEELLRYLAQAQPYIASQPSPDSEAE